MLHAHRLPRWVMRFQNGPQKWRDDSQILEASAQEWYSWKAFSPSDNVFSGLHRSKTGEGLSLDTWDLSTGELLSSATVEGNFHGALPAAFSWDGILLSNQLENGDIQIWDVPNGRALERLGASDSSISWSKSTICFSADCEQLIQASDAAIIQTWDLSSGEQIKSIGFCATGVHDLVFLMSGQRLATLSNDRTVQIWHSKEGNLLCQFNSQPSDSSQAPEDEKFLVATDSDIQVWNASTHEMRGMDHFDDKTYGDLHSAVLSKNGQHLSIIEEQLIRVWNVVTGDLIHVLEDSDSEFNFEDSVLSSSGTLMATVLSAGLLVRDLTVMGNDLPRQSISCLKLSSDEKTLAVGAEDGSIRFWDIVTGSARTMPDSNPGLVKGIASRILNIVKGSVSTIPSGRIGNVEKLVFSLDGRWLVSHAERPVGERPRMETILWDLGPKPNHVILSSENLIGLTFSPDNQTLAWITDQNEVVLIDILSRYRSRRTVAQPGGRLYSAQGPIFSHDGKYLVFGIRVSLHVLDVQSQKTRILDTSKASCPISVAVSQGGKILASDDRLKSLRVWDLETGQLLYWFKCPPFTQHMRFAGNDEFLETSLGRLDLRNAVSDGAEEKLRPVGWSIDVTGEWWIQWEGRNILYVPEKFRKPPVHTIFSGDLFMFPVDDHVVMLELDSDGPGTTEDVRTLPIR